MKGMVSVMDNVKEKQLKIFAVKERMHIVDGIFNAKAGHPGGSLSIADVLAYLYNCEMNIDPKDPKMQDRDRLVLSKGHAAPALYATLALKGYFPESEIKDLRKIGKMLQGHPDMKHTPGVDMSTGSLGQGISAAVGMALAAKKFNEDYRVYTILGDGEIEEGQVWEAAMFAGFNKLDNLVAYVDYNKMQIDGTIDEVVSPHPVDKKFEAFGWNVITIDGHDFNQIESAYKAARECKGKPTCIVANSIKGKGVSFMESQVGWHGKAPNAEEYETAMSELKDALAELEV